MASRVKVEELRAELATTGIKSTLVCPTLSTHIFLLPLFGELMRFSLLQVRRLESALRKQKKQAVAVDSDCKETSRSKKRSWDEAYLQFLFTLGLRKLWSWDYVTFCLSLVILSTTDPCWMSLLISFLNRHLEPMHSSEEEDLTVMKKQKLVVATKKGAAVLDQCPPDNIKTHYRVLQKVNLNTYS